MKTRYLVMVFLFVSGIISNSYAEEGKSCLFEICDGDKIKDVKEKGYKSYYFINRLMYSKRLKFRGYNAEVAAYFKDKYSPLCDKSIRIYFDEWDKGVIEKLIKGIVPKIRFNVPLTKSEPASKEAFFKVSTKDGLKDFIKYVRRREQSMIRISLGPMCVMTDKKNDYFRAKYTLENMDDFMNRKKIFD